VYRGAARLFVNKFVYRLRRPRRWEVAVFLYPLYGARCPVCDWEGTVESPDAMCPDCGATELELEARNFIKRIVGLPGETVRLRDGDVHVDGAIARKPRHVQGELWFHVFDSLFRPRNEVLKTWEFGQGSGRWQRYPEGGVLALDARGAGEPVMAAFARQITDFYSYDGLSYELAPYRFHPAGRNPVGDCRIRARVRLLEADPSGGAVVMAIEDAGHRFTYTVGAGSSPGASLQEDGGRMIEDSGVGLSGERAQWLCLENYDDRVVAYLDGKEVFGYEYRGGPGDSQGIEFGAKGARLLWERIVIERDIHYVNVRRSGNGEPVYQLGPEEYFVLGDNSPASSDSRRWPRPGIPADHLIGRAFFVFWPVHYMKWLAAGPDAGGS
jgi:signal peptidase I